MLNSVTKITFKDQAPPAKRRRADEDGTAVVTAVVKVQIQKGNQDPKPTPNGNAQGKNKGPRKSNTPFQRIKADEISFVDERLKDNSFAAKVRMLILNLDVFD